MKGKIDVVGLRAIEEELQGLAGAITIGLEAIVDGWRFVFFTFEHEGDGCAWVSSVRGREKLPEVARTQAEQLRRYGSEVGLLRIPVDGPIAGAVTPEQLEKLAVLTKALSEIILPMVPPRWGFALLLYSNQEAGQIWLSDSNRPDLANWLEDWAEMIEAGGARPPGALGREH
jgi:hypothetical protein